MVGLLWAYHKEKRSGGLNHPGKVARDFLRNTGTEEPLEKQKLPSVKYVDDKKQKQKKNNKKQTPCQEFSA